MHDFFYFFNRHYRADFIIYIHNRNKNGFIINRICDFRCTDAAEFIRHKANNLKALLFKFIRRLKHAFMLYCRDNYSVSPAPARLRGTEKRKVICLRCAAGKKDFFLFAGKRICKCLPCGNYFLCGLYSGAVQTGWICKILREHAIDCLNRLRARLCGGTVIKICCHFLSFP